MSIQIWRSDRDGEMYCVDGPSGTDDWVSYADHVAELASKEREIERLTAQVEEMDILAEAGLCQFSVGGKHEFLKDIRQIAADAEIQGGITHVADRAAEKGGES
jgi:delta-aminolevulinic acid dehydratase/porphobilinogen synthase